MYDWANSVYNLVITTTFFPIYFTSVAKDNPGTDKVTFLGRTFINSSLYDYCLAVAYLLIALSYPVLTSIADTRGNKKSFMQFFCYMGAIGCSALFFFTDVSRLGLGIAAFMLASMGYVGSLVFYNAYLPEIAAPADRDRISARGFSFGYIGSVIMQLIGFALVVTMKDAGFATQLTFLGVGLWWVGFAQITFARLPKTVKEKKAQTVNVFKKRLHRSKGGVQRSEAVTSPKTVSPGIFLLQYGCTNGDAGRHLVWHQTVGAAGHQINHYNSIDSVGSGARGYPDEPSVRKNGKY